MLPALLAGPLGKAFPIRSQPPKPGDKHPPPIEEMPPRAVETRPAARKPRAQ